MNCQVMYHLIKKLLLMKVTAVFLLVLAISSLGRAFRILGLFTSCTKSHDIFTAILAKALSRNGHNITVVTGLPKLYDGLETLHVKDLADVRECKLFNYLLFVSFKFAFKKLTFL